MCGCCLCDIYGDDVLWCDSDSVAVCGIVDGNGLYGLSTSLRLVIEQTTYILQQPLEERGGGG